MLSISTLRTASVLVADQMRRPAAQQSAAGSAGALLLAGKTIDAKQAQPFPADSIYSVNHVDVNKQKVNLAERLAKAFDLDITAFKELGGLAHAVEQELEKLKPKEAAELELKVGKKLELDELGLSLRDLLDAMKEPGGEKDRKLEAALAAKLGTDKAGTLLEDLGIYGPSSGR